MFSFSWLFSSLFVAENYLYLFPELLFDNSIIYLRSFNIQIKILIISLKRFSDFFSAWKYFYLKFVIKDFIKNIYPS